MAVYILNMTNDKPNDKGENVMKSVHNLIKGSKVEYFDGNDTIKIGSVVSIAKRADIRIELPPSVHHKNSREIIISLPLNCIFRVQDSLNKSLWYRVIVD